MIFSHGHCLYKWKKRRRTRFYLVILLIFAIASFFLDLGFYTKKSLITTIALYRRSKTQNSRSSSLLYHTTHRSCSLVRALVVTTQFLLLVSYMFNDNAPKYYTGIGQCGEEEKDEHVIKKIFFSFCQVIIIKCISPEKNIKFIYSSTKTKEEEEDLCVNQTINSAHTWL